MSKGSRAPTKIEDMDVDLTRFDWISLSFLISCIMDFHVCPQLLKEKNVILKHILGNFLDIRMAESLWVDMTFSQVPIAPEISQLFLSVSLVKSMRMASIVLLVKNLPWGVFEQFAGVPA